MNSIWSRRTWLTHQTALLGMLSARWHWESPLSPPTDSRRRRGILVPRPTERLDPGPVQALTVRAVDAARTAGATYADVRCTRTVKHGYQLTGGQDEWTRGCWDERSDVGVGVRALVDGYWGFAASPFWEPDAVVHLARDAVAQARVNSAGPTRAVELEPIPVVTGSWTTPIAIDPFGMPMEELLAEISHWKAVAQRSGCPFTETGRDSDLGFHRQERVLATSEGSLVTQTLYETTGEIMCRFNEDPIMNAFVVQIEPTGQGWECFRHAQIPEQLTTLKERKMADVRRRRHNPLRPSEIGRYTVVCDGATMASLLHATIGSATQLDRALGYEANASGTSFLDDPLAMVGTLPVASPLVTVTANRAAPTQLATVQWDDEGVVPPAVSLVTAGVLTDFQTTREQAAWLAPYYHAQGRPVRSNGCAGAEDAHHITMQHMPNLALAPSASAIDLAALVADVSHGIFLEKCEVLACDFQARTGLVSVGTAIGGGMTEITNGKLGSRLSGGTLRFETLDLWKNVIAVGGASTQMVLAFSQFNGSRVDKGQPSQATSHSVQAVAATIRNQPFIDLTRGQQGWELEDLS